MSSSDPDEQPGDRQQVMHRFGCGHTVRATRRMVRLRPERCSACRLAEWEATAPQRRRQRRHERAEQAKALGPRPSATPAQRAAQRVIVALVQPVSGRSYLDAATREFRIIERRNEWGPTLSEIAAHLETLGVRYRAMVSTSCRGGGGTKARMELVIAPEDRRELVVWVPSLAAKIARAEGSIEAET
jgi:hypothetical protein